MKVNIENKTFHIIMTDVASNVNYFISENINYS